MKTTPNLIEGEIYAILCRLVLPFEKRYNKGLYERKFFIHVARTIKQKLPYHTIGTSETATDYILRIDRA